jgi:hypothetical protein
VSFSLRRLLSLPLSSQSQKKLFPSYRRLLRRQRVPGVPRRVQLPLPLLVQRLVLVPPVAEGPHGADVEVVLALADARDARLGDRLVEHALVDARAVGLEAVLEQPGALLGGQLVEGSRRAVGGGGGAGRVGAEAAVSPARSPGDDLPVGGRDRKRLCFQLCFQRAVLRRRRRVSLSAPHPLHRAQARLPRSVEVARGAVLVGHDRGGLQPVGEDDVGVHRGDVEVVDQRALLAGRLVAQRRQRVDHGVPDALVVLEVLGRRAVELRAQGVAQVLVDGVDQGLVGRRVAREARRQVGAEHARLERLDLAPDVRLGLERLPPERLLLPRHVLVRGEDAGQVGLDHQEGLAQRPRPLSQDVVRVERDDRRQREDERVHVGQVEVEGRDRVGDGVGGHGRGVAASERDHVLRVDLDRVVAELGLGDGLEAAGALREVGVAVDPGVLFLVVAVWFGLVWFGSVVWWWREGEMEREEVEVSFFLFFSLPFFRALSFLPLSFRETKDRNKAPLSHQCRQSRCTAVRDSHSPGP